MEGNRAGYVLLWAKPGGCAPSQACSTDRLKAGADRRRPVAGAHEAAEFYRASTRAGHCLSPAS
jgi:hypothetical protein